EDIGHARLISEITTLGVLAAPAVICLVFHQRIIVVYVLMNPVLVLKSVRLVGHANAVEWQRYQADTSEGRVFPKLSGHGQGEAATAAMAKYDDVRDKRRID